MAQPKAPRTFKQKLKITSIILGSLLLPVAGFVAYTYVTLHWAYSEGERSGVLQKFSRKGWICKTGEGEIQLSTIPGSAPTVWSFTVRDETLVKKLDAALGHQVAIHYTEHPGVPTTCFGDTNYYADDVRLVQ